MMCNTISLVSRLLWKRFRWKYIDIFEDYWEKFHLIELNVLIKFHQNNQKVIYFWRFDLYQRLSSEEAGTRSSSGSWRDKLQSSQESGRMYDWVGSSLRPGSWIVDLPSQVSRYQKGKTNLDFTEARDSEWQWHQLGHMQVCTSLQTDNHANTSPLCFLQAGSPSCRPTNSVKALKA